MSKAFKYDSARINENSDEDTVELELKPEYLLALSQAADKSPEAVPESLPYVERAPVSRAYLPPAPREPAHATDVRVSLSIAAVLSLLALVVALWPTQERAKTPVQSIAPTLATNASPTAHSEPSEVQGSPMRFTNPFDASEVFEFPAGTTEDAARESVKEVLLQRALERRTQIRSLKHVRNHRPAPLRSTPLTSACGARSQRCG